MKKYPVVIPFYTYTEYKIVCVSQLRDLQNISKTCWYIYFDWDNGVVGLVKGDRRHQLVVTLLKHQKRGIVLIWLILALNYLTSLIHAEHTHVSDDCQNAPKTFGK